LLPPRLLLLGAEFGLGKARLFDVNPGWAGVMRVTIASLLVGRWVVRRETTASPVLLVGTVTKRETTGSPLLWLLTAAFLTAAFLSSFSRT